MPGPAHEVLLSALRDEPDLLVQLVHKITGRRLRSALTLIDSNVRFARPAEVRPDLVFRGEGRRWILVELQHRIDRTKRRRWLLAASALFDQEGVMGEVVILTASRSVGAWARRAAHVRGELGTRLELTPLVLLVAGRTIEALLDPAHPELALFAAWAVHDRRGPRARAIVQRARLVGVSVDALPESLVQRLADTLVEQAQRMLELVAPLTTRTVPDGARYLRDNA
jgi:hypothetical protein